MIAFHRLLTLFGSLFRLCARHADSRPAIPPRHKRSAPLPCARAGGRQATIIAQSESNDKPRLYRPALLRAALLTCPRRQAMARSSHSNRSNRPGGRAVGKRPLSSSRIRKPKPFRCRRALAGDDRARHQNPRASRKFEHVGDGFGCEPGQKRAP